MEITQAYKKFLKGEFYKCLCKFEKKEDGLANLISLLLYEVKGLQYVAKNSVSVIRLSSILERFNIDVAEENPNITVIRKMVFKSMDLIDSLDEVGEDL